MYVVHVYYIDIFKYHSNEFVNYYLMIVVYGMLVHISYKDTKASYRRWFCTWPLWQLCRRPKHVPEGCGPHASAEGLPKLLLPIPVKGGNMTAQSTNTLKLQYFSGRRVQKGRLEINDPKTNPRKTHSQELFDRTDTSINDVSRGVGEGVAVCLQIVQVLEGRGGKLRNKTLR